MGLKTPTHTKTKSVKNVGVYSSGVVELQRNRDVYWPARKIPPNTNQRWCKCAELGSWSYETEKKLQEKFQTDANTRKAEWVPFTNSLRFSNALGERCQICDRTNYNVNVSFWWSYFGHILDWSWPGAKRHEKSGMLGLWVNLGEQI